jgi:hypothetical protein
MPKLGLTLTQKKLQLATKGHGTRTALTASDKFRTPEREGLLRRGASRATQHMNNHSATKTKSGTCMCVSIAALSSLVARSGSDAVARHAGPSGEKLTAKIATIKPQASLAKTQRAEKLASEARSTAQGNAATNTCGCRMRSAKTRHAAKRFSEDHKARARQRSAVTAGNTAAANAPGITAGEQIVLGKTGARSTWLQRRRVHCRHRSARNANC